jgi:peroxiredoxin
MGRGGSPTLEAGERAPDVTFVSLAGEAVALEDLRGAGPLVLAFYKASCPTCQLALPFLERLRKGGVRVFCVAQDNAATARGFNAEYEMVGMPTLIDPAGDGYPASCAFGLTHVPSIFYIEPDGAISWSSVGFVRFDLEGLGRQLDVPVFHDGDIVPAAKAG